MTEFEKYARIIRETLGFGVKSEDFSHCAERLRSGIIHLQQELKA